MSAAVSNMPPVLAFVAFSGTGKTTLLSDLIPALRAHGLRCAVIKHSHHDFEIDQPGKDSHRLRAAGAQQVLLASPHRVFWVREGDGHTEPRLAELLTMLDARAVDLVLVEGFRQESVAKIEVHRPSLETPLLCEQDSSIIALACDASPRAAVGIPLLPLNDASAVAEFVLRWFAERTATDR